MRRAIPVAAVVGLLVASSAGASVNISAQGSAVTIDAKMAPLGEVLQQLSRATGMKLDISGQIPRTPLNLTLINEPLASAVGRILEGAGIDFALTLDATRQKVVNLIILGKSATPTAAGARPNAPQPIVRQPFEEATEEDPTEDEIDDPGQPLEGPVFPQQPLPPGQGEQAQPLPPPGTAPPFGTPGAPLTPQNPPPEPETGPANSPKFPTYQPFAAPTPAATPAPTTTPAPAPPDQQSVVPRPGRGQPTPKPPSQ